MLIIIKISEKCQVGSILAKYLDFGQNFRKTSILVDIDENLDFGQN